jgi:hypothetical protein
MDTLFTVGIAAAIALFFVSQYFRSLKRTKITPK